MGNIWADLDIVKLLLVYVVGNILPSAVPSHLVARITPVDISSKGFHLARSRIAAHKADTRNVLALGGHHGVNGFGVERETRITPQMGTVTTRTTTRTPRDIDSKGSLVRDFLKNDVCIKVLKHCGNNDGVLLPGGLARSC